MSDPNIDATDAETAKPPKRKPGRPPKVKPPVEGFTTKENTDTGSTPDPEFQVLMQGLKKKFKGRIFMGDEYTMPWTLRRLPTGILGLDIALNGGFPAGGMSMLLAPEGIGKNWLANQVIREQQKLFGARCKIAIISTEMPYDKLFAKACGVRVALSDMEIRALERAEASAEENPNFRFTPEQIADFKDQVGEFIVVPPDTAERALTIAIECIASRQFNVVVIDSFGSMLTELEEEKTLEEANRVGGASIVNTSFSRRLNHATAPDENGVPNMTCTIAINQVRDNMKMANPNSPTTVEPGGHALKHARWAGVQLKRTAFVNKKVGDLNIRIGKTIEWEITKQKAGGHEGAKGTYNYLFGMTGIDRWQESIIEATNRGIISKTASRYEFEGISVVGIDAFVAEMKKQGLDVLEEIEKRTLIAAGVRCNYTDEDAA